MARNVRYEDIHVGDKASLSKTISEYDVYAFAGVTGDFNPVHVNAEFAKNSLFKQRIAHGMFQLVLFRQYWEQNFRNRYDLYEPGTQFFSACFIRGYADRDCRMY